MSTLSVISAVLAGVAVAIAVLVAIIMADSKEPAKKRNKKVANVIVACCCVVLFCLLVIATELPDDPDALGFYDPEASLWDLFLIVAKPFVVIAVVAAGGGLVYLLHLGLVRSSWRRSDTPAPAPASSSFVAVTLDKKEWDAAPSHGNEKKLLGPPNWVIRGNKGR